MGKGGCWIHRKVDVRHRCTRVIENEAKRSPALSVASPEIRADDRRRRPLLLTVPQRAMLTEISLVESAGFALFEVGMQGGEAALDFRVAVFVGPNLVFGEVAGAGKDGAEGLNRKSARFNLLFREDEIFVVARRQAAFDLKEIGDSRKFPTGS